MRIIISSVLVLLCKLSFGGVKITFTDYIVSGKDTLKLSNRPLDPYFDLYPGLKPLPEKPFIHAHNQYTAIYVIKDSSLYLTAIYTDKTDTNNPLSRKNLICEVFEGRKVVRMDWYSATLVFGTEPLGGSKNIYGNQRDEDFYVAQIGDGEVISIVESKAQKIKRLRHRLFKEFASTPQCLALKKRIFPPNSDLKQKEFERYLQNRIFDYTTLIRKEKTFHNKM
jgi:hypothetical protein